MLSDRRCRVTLRAGEYWSTNAEAGRAERRTPGEREVEQRDEGLGGESVGQ